MGLIFVRNFSSSSHYLATWKVGKEKLGKKWEINCILFTLLQNISSVHDIWSVIELLLYQHLG